MPTIEERIKRLSAPELEIFKKQLPLRLKELNETDRNTALEQLKTLPGLLSEPEPAERPWWQHPLDWMRGVEKTTGAIVTSPFTPRIGGAEGLSWLEREKAEYEAFEEPSVQFQPLFRLPWTPEEIRQTPWTLGVKGAVEQIPWFATSIATAGLSTAGMLGAKAGLTGVTKASQYGLKALKPIIRAEQLPARVIGKAISPATKPIAQAVRRVTQKTIDQADLLVPDLQPIGEAISIATSPSKLHNLVNISVKGQKPLAALGRAIAGMAAVADNPAKLALVGHYVQRFEAANKALIAISALNRMGTSKNLFKLSDEGFMNIAGKSVRLNTIRTYPQRYARYLTKEQKAWIEQASLLERGKYALYKRYGIEVPELTFEEGGEYAGRRVVAKISSDNQILDVAYIGKGQPRKPGIKPASFKERVYANSEDAVKDGFRYLSEEEALYYNLLGAWNTVANKEFTDYFLASVPWRTMAGPEDLKAQVNLFRAGIHNDKKALLAAHKQLKASSREVEQLKKVTFKQTEDVVDLTKEIIDREALLKNTQYLKGKLVAERKYADKLARTYANAANRDEAAYQKILQVEARLAQREADLSDILPQWQKALARARRPAFGGVTAPDIPAFAGKVFTGPEAKEYINLIRKELDPGFNSVLNAANQVNAVGRYFALAGDASPFAIQLIFLAGDNPKVFGQAVKGFVQAMFDPLYHDNMLAKKMDVLYRHPGLSIFRGGSTQLTEAMGKGGLLRKQPLKLMGKVLEPFQRGVEGALDTAGIGLAESLEHLGTTPARMAQVDAFINEFRGLISTERLGVSAGQRQWERALVLAPQYNRAIVSLLWDVAQGNLRGQLARRAMAKGVGAIMAMSVAVSYALGEDMDEIADHLNPMSSNFLTWDIAGQRIGPGSKVRSLLYTFGKITKDPEDAAYHAGRFVRGNFSPVIGTSMDLITGKNYAGDPTRDGLASLTKTLLGENFLPIWVQSVSFEGGDFSGRLARGLAEFGGLRAYPAGTYTKVLEAQDKLSQEKYGMSWEELGRQPEGLTSQMKLTREIPGLQELQSQAAEESQQYARGEQLVWNQYGREVDYVNDIVNKELDVSSRQFRDTGDGATFRQRVNQAYWLKGQMLSDLLKRNEFALIKEEFEKPLTAKQRAMMQPQKLLFRDYNELMYSADMYDEYGEYRFDEANLRRQRFAQQYGLAALQSVEDIIGERRADEPSEVKLLRQAREVLRPYWEIETQVWSRYPAGYKRISDEIKIIERTDKLKAKGLLRQYPFIVMARREIAFRKKLLKAANPQVASALATFY